MGLVAFCLFVFCVCCCCFSFVVFVYLFVLLRGVGEGDCRGFVLVLYITFSSQTYMRDRRPLPQENGCGCVLQGRTIRSNDTFALAAHIHSHFILLGRKGESSWTKKPVC